MVPFCFLGTRFQALYIIKATEVSVYFELSRCIVVFVFFVKKHLFFFVLHERKTKSPLFFATSLNKTSNINCQKFVTKSVLKKLYYTVSKVYKRKKIPSGTARTAFSIPM